MFFDIIFVISLMKLLKNKVDKNQKINSNHSFFAAIVIWAVNKYFVANTRLELPFMC